MIIAQHTRNLPRAVPVLPQMHKACFSLTVDRLGLGMQKTVHAQLDGSIAFHVVNLHSSRHQDSLCVACADVVLDALGEFLPAQRYASLVMVKLHIVGQQAVERLQVTVVVSVEELCIESSNGLVQVGLILDVVQCGDLGVRHGLSALWCCPAY